MGLLWTLVGWASWLAWTAAALALELAPVAAILCAALVALLVSAMTAQALEHGVLLSVHRSKWHKASGYDTLHRDFYRGYWGLTLLYLVGCSLWLFFTERSGARAAYGAVFCALWWGLQLAMVVALTPFDQVLARANRALARTQ